MSNDTTPGKVIVYRWRPAALPPLSPLSTCSKFMVRLLVGRTVSPPHEPFSMIVPQHHRQVDAIGHHHHLPTVPGAVGVGVRPWRGELPPENFTWRHLAAVPAVSETDGIQVAEQPQGRVVDRSG